MEISIEFRCNECGAGLDATQRGDVVDVEPCHSCMEDLTNKVEELENENEKLEDKNEDLEDENCSLKEQVESLESQIDSLNAIIIHNLKIGSSI